MKHDATWKSLRKDYTISQIVDGFAGAFVLTIFAVTPIIIILGEMITVYMYLLTLFVIMIIIALFAAVALLHFLWRKSLLLKKQSATTDIKTLFIRSTIIVNAVVLVIGLVFLFVLIPILWA